MKDLPSGLLTHYQGGATTLARLWRCERRDGQVFGFTDHDGPITFETVVYEPRSGFTASALKSGADFSVDNLELAGLLDSDFIAPEDIEAGLWDGASIQLLEVNWADLSMGANVLRVGELGEIQREGLNYRAELRGLLHRLQNNIGRIVTPGCDAQLGDARCGVDIEALRVSGVVTTSADNRSFTASALTQAAGYFTFGIVTWTSGANDGWSMEVRSHATGGVIGLQLEMPHPILPGDGFTIIPGCDRSKAVCISKFDNVVNFRGFSFVPGEDKIMLVGGQ